MMREWNAEPKMSKFSTANGEIRKYETWDAFYRTSKIKTQNKEIDRMFQMKLSSTDRYVCI